MKITIESDQDISELTIKFANGTSVVKTTPVPETELDRPTRSEDSVIPSFASPVKASPSAEPIVPVSTEEREAKVDEDFASVDV